MENDKIASWLDGTRAILLAVYRQPDANTVEVVDRVRAMLPAIQAELITGVEILVLNDRSVSIRDAIEDVQFTLCLAGFLVIIAIYFFLRSFRATLIPAIALPISVVGTFAGMYLCGHSIDNISLLALTLAVGFVVDDAIVMLENIVRHIEAGEKPKDAAFKGSKEVGFTIVSMTLSLVAVFIPVLFMGGVVGRMFNEFGLVISMAILRFVRGSNIFENNIVQTVASAAEQLAAGRDQDHRAGAHDLLQVDLQPDHEIGRASCRERV